MKSAFQITDLSLKNLIILNFDIIIHVFNDLSQFSNFQKILKKEYVITEQSKVLILRYDNVMLQITKKNDKKRILRLKNVIFCTDFVTNLVSFKFLRKKEIHWNTINNFLFWESDSSLILSGTVTWCGALARVPHSIGASAPTNLLYIVRFTPLSLRKQW